MFLSVHAVTGCKSDDKVESLLSYLFFFFILWIRTGLQNPCGFGNSCICLRSLEVKSI